MIRNTKVLSETELTAFENKYNVDCAKKYVLFSLKKVNTNIFYKGDSNFSVSAEKRKLTISPKAVEYWKKMNQKYSLFRVQNTMNYFLILHKEYTFDDVKDYLEKGGH